MTDTRIPTAAPAPPPTGRPHRRSRRPRRLVLAALAVAALAAATAALVDRSRPVPTVNLSAPSTAELDVAAQSRVVFGHQSVGDNILGGVGALYAAAGVSEPEVVDTREPVPGADGYIAHTHVGANGDPLSKLADFAEVAGGPLGTQADVLLLKLCYADITASSDVEAVFDAYVAAMTAIQAAHPDATVLYTTVPVTADRSLKAKVKALLGRDDQMGPADNLARQRYNELIRERYQATGRLFDVAAAESTLASDPALRGEGAEQYAVLNPALMSDAGHLNAHGAQVVAADLMRLIAAHTPTR
ncbi:SGNH/GDSL hydrolase family protein [Xylanimonas ulmi]|uniref:GDSL-like lipase/acylhydrolase family protein n=1 Tax=Xylanimonas ulmi TaxID=228973 RepID=A0A4Q7M4A6_9MICO|nr:SGNH/GDSL hydrolase family protein [Xylanibacterium ulmi]RZS61843.1 hypothetical protein EV386_2155 [Xylanibacterium ulmi]